jgi:hypothetical protein
VRESVLEAYPDAELAVAIVWINMMESDDAAAVAGISKVFTDSRVQQFSDPNQAVGKAVAASLGSDGEVSWDTYLFYGPGLTWDGTLPPFPTEYLHQLYDYIWADQAKMRTGQDLLDGLRLAMAILTK